MTVIDRQWALNQLRHSRNSAILSLAAMQMLNSDLIYDLDDKVVVLKTDGITFNPEPYDRQGARVEVNLGQLTHDYRHDHDSLIAIMDEFWKAARRTLIKEGFEVTRKYAAAMRGGAIETQPWYQFSRVIRNCLSHDFHFRFSKYDLRQLPVSWAGKEINASLNDKDLPNNFLDPHATWSLFSEMEAFVTNS